MTRPLAATAALLLTIGAATVSTAAAAVAASPPAYGFVLVSRGAPVPNATFPATTTVSTVGVGKYRITFPGIAAAGGVVHVTAVNEVPHWCQADMWYATGADETVLVDCYAPTPFTGQSVFCALKGPWIHPLPDTAARLACWDDAGNYVNTLFLMSDSSRV